MSCLPVRKLAIRLARLGISTPLGWGGCQYILLRNQSRISATAGTRSGFGNGGNININTGFLVAVPQENSDITANAFFGNGGNVNVTANFVYGIGFRDFLTGLSDITASSRFGLNGTVGITLTSFDASQGATELPSDLTDRADQIFDDCIALEESSFASLGRGGLSEVMQTQLGGSSVWRDRRDVLNSTATIPTLTLPEQPELPQTLHTLALNIMPTCAASPG